jgi:hypothetical protein
MKMSDWQNSSSSSIILKYIFGIFLCFKILFYFTNRLTLKMISN